jgi:hypothetical protein
VFDFSEGLAFVCPLPRHAGAQKAKGLQFEKRKRKMVMTVHCANRRCEAYKKPVKYTFVYLRRSKDCVVCGSVMVDGERSNDDFKNGRKRVGRRRVGKALVVRGHSKQSGSKKKRKSPARKRTSYKR